MSYPIPTRVRSSYTTIGVMGSRCRPRSIRRKLLSMMSSAGQSISSGLRIMSAQNEDLGAARPRCDERSRPRPRWPTLRHASGSGDHAALNPNHEHDNIHSLPHADGNIQMTRRTRLAYGVSITAVAIGISFSSSANALASAPPPPGVSAVQAPPPLRDLLPTLGLNPAFAHKPINPPGAPPMPDPGQRVLIPPVGKVTVHGPEYTAIRPAIRVADTKPTV